MERMVFIALFLFTALLLMRREVFAESGARFFLLSKIAAGFAAFFLAGRGVTLSIMQYQTWKNAGGASALLLPPHQPIGYFLGYAWLHFGKAAAFSIVFAALLFAAIQLGNRASANRFFYREEPYLAAFGVLAAPWPAGFLAMAGALVAGVALQAAFFLVGRRGRVPLLFFWLPMAIIATVFGDIIGKWLGLTAFRV